MIHHVKDVQTLEANIPTVPRFILMVLAIHANSYGVCHVKRSTIAHQVAVRRLGTVTKWLTWLEHNGWIERDVNGWAGRDGQIPGNKRPNRYRLTLAVGRQKLRDAKKRAVDTPRPGNTQGVRQTSTRGIRETYTRKAKGSLDKRRARNQRRAVGNDARKPAPPAPNVPPPDPQPRQRWRCLAAAMAWAARHYRGDHEPIMGGRVKPQVEGATAPNPRPGTPRMPDPNPALHPPGDPSPPHPR